MGNRNLQEKAWDVLEQKTRNELEAILGEDITDEESKERFIDTGMTKREWLAAGRRSMLIEMICESFDGNKLTALINKG